MPLPNNAAYTTLFNDIVTTHTAEFAANVAAREDQLIADAYCLDASPTFWVWRTGVSLKEIYETTTADATAWSTTAYIARSTAERDAWRDVFVLSGTINFSLLNARQGLADIFSGAPGAGQRQHLLAIGRRPARRIEQLLATGTGSTASPGTLTFEGRLTGVDVAKAFGRA